MELIFAQFGQKPFDSFIPGLVYLKRAQKELRKGLGTKSKKIIHKVLTGEQLSRDDLDNCHDILVDLVLNEPEVVKTIIGLGSYGRFDINILKFGDVYWIQASEDDEIGYFGSEDEAESVAEANYEPNISAAYESKGRGKGDE